RGGDSGIARRRRRVAHHGIATRLRVGERERVEVVHGAREREAGLVRARIAEGGRGAGNARAAVGRDREGRAGQGLRLVEILRPGDRDGGAVGGDGRGAHRRRGRVDRQGPKRVAEGDGGGVVVVPLAQGAGYFVRAGHSSDRS